MLVGESGSFHGPRATASTKTSVTVGYGEYRRLAEWATAHGVPVRNVDRDRRLAERDIVDAGTTSSTPARTRQDEALPPSDVLMKRLGELRGITTIDELLRTTAGSEQTFSAAKKKVAAGSLKDAVCLSVRGRLVVVQKFSGVLHAHTNERIRLLTILDEHTDPRLVERATSSLKRSLPRARHDALMEELGTAKRARSRPKKPAKTVSSVSNTAKPIAEPEPEDRERTEADAVPEADQSVSCVPASDVKEESVSILPRTPEPIETRVAAPHVSATVPLPAIVIRHQTENAEAEEPSAATPSDVARVAATPVSKSAALAVFAEFDGDRTQASCVPSTGRTSIIDGPLRGVRFLDPTAAAIAVARKASKDVPIPVNGWRTWIADDGSGRPLEDCIVSARKESGE